MLGRVGRVVVVVGSMNARNTWEAAALAKAQARGHFGQRYAFGPDKRDTGNRHRLGDLMVSYQSTRDGSEPPPADKNQFAVIDTVRREVGFFERQEKGTEPADIQRMVESFFNCRAVCITASIWVV